MDIKRSSINIFFGSVLGAAFMTILVGFAIIDKTPNDLVCTLGIAAIILISSFLIQKTIRQEFPFFIFLSAIGLSVLALYFSFGLQARESERLFILALATLILFVLNLVIFLIRSKLRKKAEHIEKQSVSRINFLYPAVLAVIVFIIPIFLSVYLNAFMPPLVEPGGSVRYDQSWQRGGESETGLLLSFWARKRGNVDDFHWVTSAYLISREWTKNPEEPWKFGSYVRRAKFYSDKVESFNLNNPSNFEGETYSSEFFLPYSVISEGRNQGNFPDYRPEPLSSIISGSDRIQFGVETITVVSKSKDKFAREGIYGKVRSDIFLLNEYAGHTFAEENYSTSQWLAMVYGERRYQSAQIKGQSQDFADYSTTSFPVELETGTVSRDTKKGITVFKEKEREIASGILFNRSTALIPNDPENEQLGYRGLRILKFTNTTGNPQKLEFIEEIPKNLAQNVNQLQFKIFTGDPELSITNILNDIHDFVSISDFVNSGHAEIIKEDPLLRIIIWGAVAVAASTQIISIYVPQLVGVQPRMDKATWNKQSDAEVLKWIDARLNKYCDKIRKSAKANNIPPRLLATVTLNELADYDFFDQLEELEYLGSSHSAGWVQLQPKIVMDHGLIDIGPQDKIRDPTVDIINEDESRIVPPRFPGDSPIVYNNVLHRNRMVWERLVNPESGIELAAREISYLLNMLKKGSPYAENPWGQSLLKNPEEGIDMNNIYANLKVSDSQNNPRKQQIELEKTLAILVVSAYNGSGAIYKVKDKNSIFLINNNPWAPGNKETSDGKERPFYAPRVHAVNAAEEFTERLYEFSCLKEHSTQNTTPPLNHDYRDLLAKDILVKPEEIGEGFILFQNMLTDDNSASVEFKHSGKGISVSVHLEKKRDEAAHDRAKNDFVNKKRQEMSNQRYVVEKLNLGDYSYIVWQGKASFDAQSYPGERWHVWVIGNSYSYSGNYDENAPLVKRSVINAISAMYHRVVELESR